MESFSAELPMGETLALVAFSADHVNVAWPPAVIGLGETMMEGARGSNGRTRTLKTVCKPDGVLASACTSTGPLTLRHIAYRFPAVPSPFAPKIRRICGTLPSGFGAAAVSAVNAVGFPTSHGADPYASKRK